MNQAVGESITFAIGVAISPLPILAVVLMLLSRRSGTNSVAFLSGWIVGVSGVLTVVLAIGAAVGLSTGGSDTTDGNSTLRLVLGIALVVLGLRRLRGGAAGDAARQPRWLQSIESVGPLKAASLGAVLAGLNPKNLILIIGGGTAIAQTSATFGQKFGTAVIFVALASVTVLVPVVGYHLAKDRATRLLAAGRDWLGAHASSTVGAVLLVFGVLLIGKGVGGF